MMPTPEPRIYLASRSPRRRELLKQACIAFDVLLLREDLRRGSDVDETPFPGEAAADYALRIARAKAEVGCRQIVMRSMPLRPVLAADTTVVLDEEIMGKPRDARHAEELLARLSGRTHRVITAVAVASQDDLETAVSISEVEFRKIEPAEIRRYVETGEPLDKAGAYAIQGRAATFISAMTGSYSGIMGLPLYETAQLLRRYLIMPV